MVTYKRVVYLPFLILLCNFPIFLAQIYTVKSFNATGDGKTDDTVAVRAALAAAANSNGGRVIFDTPYTFLTGPFNVTSNVILDIRGKILGINQSSAYAVSSPNDDCNPLIGINHAKNITIFGGGVVDGQTGLWQPCPRDGINSHCSNHYRPRILNIQNTSGIIIHNIKLKNSPTQAIALTSVTDVHIYNVFILQHSLVQHTFDYNTDGIYVNGQNIVIENSRIRVGDDAIAITDLSGLSTNITVRKLKIRLSRGIRIASYINNGVTNVTFKHIYMQGDPLNGIDNEATRFNIQLYKNGNCTGLKFKSTYFDSTNPSSSRTPTSENIANVSCEYATRSWKFEARVLGYVYGSS